ncbi:hypothetical protein PIB30_050743 [Stylosanthes scabra]|uniref:Uncharacterized protein n=1 Tax=Stylosanthes scabra TaxID=79078 RepID=A0ABU6RHT6_9FABA|nr:hypothetical protein [Stylosanthes scabra]
MKMLTIETKSQNTISANNMPSNQAGPSNNPSDQGLVMQQHSINMPNQPQQQTSLTQQPMLPSQQRQQLQQLMGSQSNATNMQHPQMLGPQNNVGNMQQQQQRLQQRLRASGFLIEQQNVLDHQKQIYQSQRA